MLDQSLGSITICSNGDGISLYLPNYTYVALSHVEATALKLALKLAAVYAENISLPLGEVILIKSCVGYNDPSGLRAIGEGRDQSSRSLRVEFDPNLTGNRFSIGFCNFMALHFDDGVAEDLHVALGQCLDLMRENPSESCDDDVALGSAVITIDPM